MSIMKRPDYYICIPIIRKSGKTVWRRTGTLTAGKKGFTVDLYTHLLKGQAEVRLHAFPNVDAVEESQPDPLQCKEQGAGGMIDQVVEEDCTDSPLEPIDNPQ
jgi:hypothetical protein